MFLGSDNAPTAGMIELETTAAFVAVRMMEGLETACRALERAGCREDAARATERMSGFLQWWNSGSWSDEVHAAMTDIEAWHGRFARLLLKLEP